MCKYLIIFVLLTTFGFAQTTPQKEINEQVWKRFVEAYGKDAEAFMKIHSEKLVRLSIGENDISRFDQYKSQNESDVAFQKKSGNTVKIDFTFAYRTVAGTVAYEIGYYKITSRKADKMRNYYGMFNVILRKENGTWKILSDADTGENITEATFNSGKNWDHVF